MSLCVIFIQICLPRHDRNPPFLRPAPKAQIRPTPPRGFKFCSITTPYPSARYSALACVVSLLPKKKSFRRLSRNLKLSSNSKIHQRLARTRSLYFQQHLVPGMLLFKTTASQLQKRRLEREVPAVEVE